VTTPLVYLAQPMTGYSKTEAVKLARYAVLEFGRVGISCFSPVLEEGVKGEPGVIVSEGLDWKWAMDKDAMNRCFVLVNIRADAKSFGCEDEYGRHRYSEWQPSIRVSPRHADGYFSIANYQSDSVVGTIPEAAALVQERWGSRTKRIIWKLKIWAHLPYWVLRQLKRLGQ